MASAAFIANAANVNALAAVLAPQVVALAANYTHVLGRARLGKDLLPRVAALLGEAQVSDMKVLGSHASSARSTPATRTSPSKRAAAAQAGCRQRLAATRNWRCHGTDAAAVTAELPTHTRFVELQAGARIVLTCRPPSRVVSGGRALGSSENFDVIYAHRRRRRRCLTRRGRCRLRAERHAGQTRKIIAPELYIAIGVPGAIHRHQGCRPPSSRSTRTAKRFEVADLGLVGDLFKLVPGIEALL